jgi:hypothetical protein
MWSKVWWWSWWSWCIWRRPSCRQRCRVSKVTACESRQTSSRKRCHDVSVDRQLDWATWLCRVTFLIDCPIFLCPCRSIQELPADVVQCTWSKDPLFQSKASRIYWGQGSPDPILNCLFMTPKRFLLDAFFCAFWLSFLAFHSIFVAIAKCSSGWSLWLSALLAFCFCLYFLGAVPYRRSISNHWTVQKSLAKESESPAYRWPFAYCL